MSDTIIARFVGGPRDGDTTEVIGTGFIQPVKFQRWYDFACAKYVWDSDREGNWIGRFIGYWIGNTQLRKDGSRMPKRKKSRRTY